MTKYDGIKVVESSINDVKPQSTEKKESGGFFSGLLMRVVLAALILVMLFTLKNVDNPLAQKALDTVKSAVAYDMNDRAEDEIGEVKFLELVKRLLSTSTNEVYE